MLPALARSKCNTVPNLSMGLHRKGKALVTLVNLSGRDPLFGRSHAFGHAGLQRSNLESRAKSKDE